MTDGPRLPRPRWSLGIDVTAVVRWIRRWREERRHKRYARLREKLLGGK